MPTVLNHAKRYNFLFLERYLIGKVIFIVHEFDLMVILASIELDVYGYIVVGQFVVGVQEVLSEMGVEYLYSAAECVNISQVEVVSVHSRG